MDCKTCTKCTTSKKTNEFYRRAKSTDGLNSWCKDCARQARSANYRTAAGKAKNDATGRRTRYRIGLQILEYLLGHSCVDCGEADPVVLEFDHRDPAKKSFDMYTARRSGFGWPRILEEIEKCDVRCANCHKRRTAQQFGSYRLP